MNKLLLLLAFILPGGFVFAQTTADALQKAFQQFERDPQLRHAISSLYVIDAATGSVVFEKNAQLGLAPASTQKIITSVTAFELLGKDYRYKTQLSYDGELKNGLLKGNLYITGSGDPSLGSWRYAATRDTLVLNKWVALIKAKGIKRIEGEIRIDSRGFESNAIPDGWIWQDIGNYYGAGAGRLNWHENQYDLLLRSGNTIGAPVAIAATQPSFSSPLTSEVRSARKGSGDNAYIYPPLAGQPALVTGTIPVDETRFAISGAYFQPAKELSAQLAEKLKSAGVELVTVTRSPSEKNIPLQTYLSPTLDSLVFWFNKKSINLYGEALVKTFAFEKQGYASTDSGVNIVRNFWKQKGFDEEELNMRDGSGLSPLNRVTTHMQVEILKYARTRDWYPLFYNALPEYNGMRMKSGTISDVKGFCGYQKSSNGREYIFSFLVNNYNGSASGLVKKMYEVLDKLK